MSDKPFKHVGVVVGGLSTEREISRKTGDAVVGALQQLGYSVTEFALSECLGQQLRESGVDVVFNALHGRYGEDGCVQGLLELLGIPYTGSDVLASALAMNKAKAKELFRLNNLPTPPAYTIGASDLAAIADIHGSFGFPAIVKPAREGSSIGIARVDNTEELFSACADALTLDDTVIVERYIGGTEVSVGILDDRALGVLEIVSHNNLLDFEAKYAAGCAHYHLPARLSPARTRGVLTQALRAHRALGCRGATRVDLIVSELGNEYLLEVNTLPGLTPLSQLPRLAAHQNISYTQLIEQILLSARLNTTAHKRPRPETTHADELKQAAG